MANQPITGIYNITFSWYDYVFFGLNLGISVAIGAYYGFFKGQHSANEYLLGGKKMNPIPVAISLAASSISGVTLLAVPADIYRYGIGYLLVCPIQILVVVITYFIYLPVFYKMEITSVFEYLAIRFCKRVQIFASLLFAISNILFLPIVIYIPALAFSQATEISIHLITPVICGVCIFYTTIGGLKTVVWTDTLQFIVMFGASAAVFYVGVISTGGMGIIWERAAQHKRLHISLELDITKRETIWSVFIGMTIMWLREITINQEFVQKCLSLPSYKDVHRALTLYIIVKVVIILLCSFTGLIMFARYFDCDPLSAGIVERTDQLLPYYIMDVAKSIPGLPGLFIAGIFSAALSTLSALMNCLAGTIYNDFISPFMPKDISQRKVSLILKCLVVIVGVTSTSLVYPVEKLGGLLGLTFSLGGITSGPLVGLFTAGMLIPVVNSTGALWGGIVSLIMMCWIVFGRQWYESQGILRYPTLPLYTDGCSNMTNSSIPSFIPEANVDVADVFILYRISFYWYCSIGVILTVIVSVAISLCTKNKNRIVKKEYFSPIIHSLFPKNTIEDTKYYTLDHALGMVNKDVN